MIALSRHVPRAYDIATVATEGVSSQLRIRKEVTMAMTIIGWIIFGLVVGVIARFLMPGDQPMGILMTTLLGVAGSFAGGYIGSLVSGRGLDMAQPAGWIGAVLGAILLLLLYGLMTRKKV
jgi:uncharacterized membrane protein YeaQ/YmgE (transglycosylase-associated protein family)